MLRNLLPLLLIASLLAGGWLPCCPPAAQAAATPTAHDCGGADPQPPDADPDPAAPSDCDDCRHCLQSPPLSLRLASLPGVAPQQHAAPMATRVDPQRQPAPLQRPPIPHLA